MTSREHILSHPSQLNTLSVPRFMRTKGLGTLRLGGNIAEHPEKKRWETELNRYYYACGCNAGATGLIISLLASAVLAIYFYSQGTWGGKVVVGGTLSITIVGAILGKLFGLMHAYKNLKRAIEEIQRHWKPEETLEGVRWSCG